MRIQMWRAALVATLALASPALVSGQVADDVRDTATEQGRNAKKTARDLKPGDKTAEDRKEDAKDTAVAKKAKTKKKARHIKNKAKAKVQDATH